MVNPHPLQLLLQEISELRAQLHRVQHDKQAAGLGPTEILRTQQSIEVLVRLNRELREGLERPRFQQ